MDVIFYYILCYIGIMVHIIMDVNISYKLLLRMYYAVYYRLIPLDFL
jgi:hypothetical protein